MNIRALITIPAIFVLATAAHGQSITKCQDEDGNWHYGDFAAEACAEKSTVTEIDERGQKIDEKEAPPSEEELEARRAAKKQEQQEAERRAREREANQRLLQTYDSAQSIIQSRDERVEAMNSELQSHRLFRQDLIDEKKRLLDNDAEQDRISSIEQQIEEYDKAINRLKREREETVEKYNSDLKRYRELTGG